MASTRRLSLRRLAPLALLAHLEQPRAAAEPAHLEQPQSKDADDAALRALLQRDVVGPATLGQRVLYTWTTAEQVAALRGQPTLLTRSQSPQQGPPNFSVVLRGRQEVQGAFPDPARSI